MWKVVKRMSAAGQLTQESMRKVGLSNFRVQKLRVLGLLETPTEQRTGSDLDELLDALLHEFSNEWAFFAQFTREEQVEIYRLLTVQELAPGEVVFSRGDRAEAFYIVYHGEVCVHQYDADADEGDGAGAGVGAISRFLLIKGRCALMIA